MVHHVLRKQLTLLGTKVDFGAKMGNKIYYAQSKRHYIPEQGINQGQPTIKKEKKRQKDAEQWYAADPKQCGFSNKLNMLFKFTAANNLGR